MVRDKFGEEAAGKDDECVVSMIVLGLAKEVEVITPHDGMRP